MCFPSPEYSSPAKTSKPLFSFENGARKTYTEFSKVLPDHMSSSELKGRLESDNPPLLIDVRGSDERSEVKIEADDMHIPMDVFTQKVDEIPKHGNVVLYCHLGIRSNAARAWMESQGIPISHLNGGIEDWLFETGF